MHRQFRNLAHDNSAIADIDRVFLYRWLAVAALAVGCADTAYLLQSTTGHLKVMQAARPVAVMAGGRQHPARVKTAPAIGASHTALRD
jgi:predicted aminopeptidase